MILLVAAKQKAPAATGSDDSGAVWVCSKCLRPVKYEMPIRLECSIDGEVYPTRRSRR